MADAVSLHFAGFGVHIDITAQFGNQIGTDAAHGFIHRPNVFDHGVVADGAVHRVAVVHIAACLSHVGDEKQIASGVQLFDKRLVDVAIERAIAEGRNIDARGEVFDPADGLMYGRCGYQPQYDPDGRNGGFGCLIGFGGIEFRCDPAPGLCDHYAGSVLIGAGYVCGQFADRCYLWSVQDGKRSVFCIERIGHTLNCGQIICVESLVAAPEGHLSDATVGEVLYRFDFGEFVVGRFCEDPDIQRDARIDAEYLRQLIMQHFHAPAVSRVGNAQLFGGVDGGNGLYVFCLEAVGNFRFGQISNESRYVVFACYAFRYVAVLSFDF